MNLYKRAARPWQEMNGRALILDPEKSAAHELNVTATFIWRLLDSPQEFDSMINLICKEFDVSVEIARADLTSCLDEMKSKRLLE